MQSQFTAISGTLDNKQLSIPKLDLKSFISSFDLLHFNRASHRIQTVRNRNHQRSVTSSIVFPLSGGQKSVRPPAERNLLPETDAGWNTRMRSAPFTSVHFTCRTPGSRCVCATCAAQRDRAIERCIKKPLYAVLSWLLMQFVWPHLDI